MLECDLYDLKLFGNFLSWRGQRYTHLVWCRLDRAMENRAWVEAYPSGRSEYFCFEGSDHIDPLLPPLNLLGKNKKGYSDMTGD